MGGLNSRVSAVLKETEKHSLSPFPPDGYFYLTLHGHTFTFHIHLHTHTHTHTHTDIDIVWRREGGWNIILTEVREEADTVNIYQAIQLHSISRLRYSILEPASSIPTTMGPTTTCVYATFYITNSWKLKLNKM